MRTAGANHIHFKRQKKENRTRTEVKLLGSGVLNVFGCSREWWEVILLVKSLFVDNDKVFAEPQSRKVTAQNQSTSST